MRWLSHNKGKWKDHFFLLFFNNTAKRKNSFSRFTAKPDLENGKCGYRWNPYVKPYLGYLSQLPRYPGRAKIMESGKNVFSTVFPDSRPNRIRKTENMGTVGILRSSRCPGWSTILQNGKTVFPDLRPNQIRKTGNMSTDGILMSHFVPKYQSSALFYNFGWIWPTVGPPRHAWFFHGISWLCGNYHYKAVSRWNLLPLESYVENPYHQTFHNQIMVQSDMSSPIRGYLSQLRKCSGWAKIMQHGKTIFFRFSGFMAKPDSKNRKYGYRWNP